MEDVVVLAVSIVRLAHDAFLDETGLGVDVDAFGVIRKNAEFDAVEVEFFESVFDHQFGGFDAVTLPAVFLVADEDAECSAVGDRVGTVESAHADEAVILGQRDAKDDVSAGFIEGVDEFLLADAVEGVHLAERSPGIGIVSPGNDGVGIGFFDCPKVDSVSGVIDLVHRIVLSRSADLDGRWYPLKLGCGGPLRLRL